jgi:hypothetical protein
VRVRRRRRAERGIVRAQDRWVVVWRVVRRACVEARRVSIICGLGEAWKVRQDEGRRRRRLVGWWRTLVLESKLLVGLQNERTEEVV